MLDTNFTSDAELHVRGTIWQYDDGGTKTFENGVQVGTRPVLIISNNKSNQHAEMINVLMLTASLKEKIYPAHVRIVLTGKETDILCNQVKTISKKNLTFYMGTIGDSVMKRVESALMMQLGITTAQTSQSKSAITEQISQLEAVAERVKDDVAKHIEAKERFDALYEDMKGFIEQTALGFTETAHTVSNDEPQSRRTKITESDKQFLFNNWADTEKLCEFFDLKRTSIYNMRSAFKAEYEAREIPQSETEERPKK